MSALVASTGAKHRLANLIAPALDRITRTNPDDDERAALRSAWINLARAFSLGVPESLPACSRCKSTSDKVLGCAACRFVMYCCAACQVCRLFDVRADLAAPRLAGSPRAMRLAQDQRLSCSCTIATLLSVHVQLSAIRFSRRLVIVGRRRPKCVGSTFRSRTRLSLR